MASFRRSSGERRLQLKWLLGGFGAALAAAVLATALRRETGVWSVVGSVAILVIFFAVPVSMGVAITKYRLYDIDRVLSRTLAYAIVTGLLIGIYAGLVLLAQQVLKASSPVAVAASTLAAAALFSPVRRRVQHLVDRRGPGRPGTSPPDPLDRPARVARVAGPNRAHFGLWPRPRPWFAAALTLPSGSAGRLHPMRGRLVLRWLAPGADENGTLAPLTR